MISGSADNFTSRQTTLPALFFPVAEHPFARSSKELVVCLMFNRCCCRREPLHLCHGHSLNLPCGGAFYVAGLGLVTTELKRLLHFLACFCTH